MTITGSSTIETTHDDALVRRVKVAEFYEQGFSLAEIAQKLEDKIGNINQDLIWIRKLWRSKISDSLGKQKQLELSKLDLIEMEAWEAWQSSKTKSESVSEVIELEPEMINSKLPKVATYKGQTINTFTPTRTTKRDKNVGNPAYLKVVFDCVAARRKLLGLDAPIRTSLEGPDGVPLTVGLKVVEVGEDDRESGPVENYTTTQKSEIPC